MTTRSKPPGAAGSACAEPTDAAPSIAKAADADYEQPGHQPAAGDVAPLSPSIAPASPSSGEATVRQSSILQKQTLVRYLFWALWFILLPAALASLVVAWLEHSRGLLAELSGPVRIPAGIVVFALANTVLYYFRHYLPFVTDPAANGLQNVPKEVVREYESAAQLLAEAERILQRHAKVIERDLSPKIAEDVQDEVQALRRLMDERPLDEAAFRTQHERLRASVDHYLAPWRKSEAREFIESIGVAILIALTLRAVVVEAFKIPSGSMLPTLQINDHIFVNKFTYGPTVPLFNVRMGGNLPPSRGDVIVFEFPDEGTGHDGQDFIKRVIGLPGDHLEVKRGHPIINGWTVPSCAVGKYPYGEQDGHSSEFGDLFVEFLGDAAYLTVYEQASSVAYEGPFHVQPGEVYVMGDNRHNSHDSRRWRGGEGAGVPFEKIQGRAMRVWFPLSRMMVPVMGHPQLPPNVPRALTEGVERCLQQRPEQTVPPPPAPRDPSLRLH